MPYGKVFIFDAAIIESNISGAIPETVSVPIKIIFLSIKITFFFYQIFNSFFKVIITFFCFVFLSKITNTLSPLYKYLNKISLPAPSEEEINWASFGCIKLNLTNSSVF